MTAASDVLRENLEPVCQGMPSSPGRRARAICCAVGQMVCRLEDPRGNMAEACRLSAEAARLGARLILLPEGCLTGNALRDPRRQAALALEPRVLDPLRETAMLHGIAICAGFATRLDDGFNLVHAAVLPSGQVLFQRKHTRAVSEPEFLVPYPDARRIVFSVDEVRVAITICSEFGVPDVMAAVKAVAPGLLLYPSAGNMPDDQVWDGTGAPTPAMAGFAAGCRSSVDMAAASVKRLGISCLAANPIGFDGEAWWPGNSYGMQADGRVVIWLKGENNRERMRGSVGAALFHVA